MASLAEITHYLDTYLAIYDVADACWNGLQVEGSLEVTTIALSVDAGQEIFRQAHSLGAQLLVTHHGHFWTTNNPSLIGWQRQRLAPLLDNHISLYTAHLPLDRHREVGNNVQLLQLLGAQPKEAFGEHDGVSISWVGEGSPTSLEDIQTTLEDGLGATLIVLPFGPKKIKRIAVMSGGGSYADVTEAIAKNVDLYVTGDTSEAYHLAKDAGLNVIFAGHYATEILGIKALGAKIKEKFGVKAAFIDLPTGL